MTKYLRTIDGHEFVYTPDLIVVDNKDTVVSDTLATQIQASATSANVKLLVSDVPMDPIITPGPVQDPAAVYATQAWVTAYLTAHAPSMPWVGATPPADKTLPWIDTGSVFTTDIRTSRDNINVLAAGTVTITLGATPLTQSEQVWRTRAGTATQLTPGAFDAGGTTLLVPGSYTLTGTAISVPNCLPGDVLTVRYNYQAASGVSAAQAVSDQPFIVDSFDRANSTTTLGSTETGQVWTVPVDHLGAQPVFGITGNLAYPVANTNNRAFAYVNTARADYTVQAKLSTSTPAANFGLVVAGVTAEGTGAACYTANLSNLSKWTNGTATTILTFATPYSTGDTMRITRKGDKFSVYRQAGSTGTFDLNGEVTDATYHGTYTGLSARATWPNARWDDFKVFAA